VAARPRVAGAGDRRFDRRHARPSQIRSQTRRRMSRSSRASSGQATISAQLCADWTAACSRPRSCWRWIACGQQLTGGTGDDRLSGLVSTTSGSPETATGGRVTVTPSVFGWLNTLSIEGAPHCRHPDVHEVPRLSPNPQWNAVLFVERVWTGLWTRTCRLSVQATHDARPSDIPGHRAMTATPRRSPRAA
jgi:hypothetical protein